MSLIGTKGTVDEFIASLPDQPEDADWFQFRIETDPKWIGGYLSAVSNAAAIAGQPFGYVVWGVDADSRLPVGTDFDPKAIRTAGDPLIAWLRRGLAPTVWFSFTELSAKPGRVVVLEVEAATATPTAFDGNRWIRVRGETKLLHQDPTLEQRLWRDLLYPAKESGPAIADCVTGEVVELLDIEQYLRLTGHRDKRRADQVKRLADDRIVSVQTDGRYTIHRHGALLFARDLDSFPNLAAKSVRVSQFDGTNRLDAVTVDETLTAGYARSFEMALATTVGCLVGRSISPVAISEVVMNALVHQDLGVRHAGPLVEIFSDRVEVSNPGVPLGEVRRLLDQRPQFRNDELIRLMFQLGMCDRRGSGIDRIVRETELHGCPPPAFDALGARFRVTLRDGAVARRLPRSERTQALYLHASLLFAGGATVTNASVRERFGLSASESTLASRYIRETISAGLIAESRRATGARSREYVPYWAAPTSLSRVPT